MMGGAAVYAGWLLPRVLSMKGVAAAGGDLLMREGGVGAWQLAIMFWYVKWLVAADYFNM
jgi:hypothetical protein